MIKSFSCSRYRNITINDMEFNRINVFIGPNNAGKTNLINAVSFLASILQQNIFEEGSTAFYKQLEQKGWSRMLQQGADKRNIVLEWIIELAPDTPLFRYNLGFYIGESEIDRRNFFITSESLSYKEKNSTNALNPYNFFNCHNQNPNEGVFSYYSDDNNIKKNKRVSLSVRNNETVLLQVDELIKQSKEFYEKYSNVKFKEGIENLVDYERRFFSYSSARFDLDTLRKDARNIGEHRRINISGTNLINVLQYWKYANVNIFKKYCDMIKPLFGVGNNLDIDLIPIPSSDLLISNIIVGNKVYRLSDLSDGTLKAMILAMILIDQNDQASVIAIDEPELNLHPAWQQIFCAWLLNSKNSRQYFISTHSPEILDELTSGFVNGDISIFALSLQGTGFQRITKENVQEYLENEWNLGDLYRAKAIEIGGWPW